MAKKDITIIYVPVAGNPYPMTIEPTLEMFQALVEGYFEYFFITPTMAIVCNEDGRLKGMQHNVTVKGTDFCGPVFFVGIKRNDWADCPQSLEDIKRLIGMEVEE